MITVRNTLPWLFGMPVERYVWRGEGDVRTAASAFRDSSLRRLDQEFGRNAQYLIQSPDHRQGQRTSAVQNLVDTAGLTDLGDKVFHTRVLLFRFELG